MRPLVIAAMVVIRSNSNEGCSGGEIETEIRVRVEFPLNNLAN